MDLSKYTDDQLKAIAAPKAAPASPLAKYSNKELQDIVDSGNPPINEMHPDIQPTDRLLLDNLANSPQAKADYLKQQGFDTRIKDDQVQVKKPGEKEYRVLEPKGFPNAKEAGLYAGGHIMDLSKGLLSAGGAALGGMAGLPTGPGALAAGMAGGAAGGALGEGLRQGLGQAVGIPQSLDMGQIASSGIGGAAAPLLVGTGAVGTQGLAKSGILGKVYDGVASLGAKAASMPEKVIGKAISIATGSRTAGKAAELLTKKAGPEIFNFGGAAAKAVAQPSTYAMPLKQTLAAPAIQSGSNSAWNYVTNELPQERPNQ